MSTSLTDQLTRLSRQTPPSHPECHYPPSSYPPADPIKGCIYCTTLTALIAKVQQMQAVLTMLAEKECESPHHQPEERITREMALDAGRPEAEGDIFTEESFERCGNCLPCRAAQSLTPMALPE